MFNCTCSAYDLSQHSALQSDQSNHRIFSQKTKWPLLLMEITALLVTVNQPERGSDLESESFYSSVHQRNMCDFMCLNDASHHIHLIICSLISYSFIYSSLKTLPVTFSWVGVWFTSICVWHSSKLCIIKAALNFYSYEYMSLSVIYQCFHWYAVAFRQVAKLTSSCTEAAGWSVLPLPLRWNTYSEKKYVPLDGGRKQKLENPNEKKRHAEQQMEESFGFYSPR